MAMQWVSRRKGFTIVELLIVIVVIAILAAITIVAYNGITARTKDSVAQASVQQAFKKVEAQKAIDGTYPAQLSDSGIVNTQDITYGYALVESGSRACVYAQVGGVSYSLQTGSPLIKGECGQVVASFYHGTGYVNPVLVRTDAQIANLWGAGSPDPLINSDNFTAKFETKVTPPVTGMYTFYTSTDDFAQLTVDGQVVIPMTNPGVRDATGTPISLTAGVPVAIEYLMRENAGSAYATLSWTYPGMTTRTTVPASAFSRP